MRSHYLRAAAAATASLDDAAYSNFFTSGASALNFNTTVAASGISGTAVEPNYAQAFIDHNLDRAWVTEPLASPAGYFTKTWGTTVPNAVSFYSLGSSTATPTNLSTYSPVSQPAHNFKDVTVGYLQDFTPVLIYVNGVHNAFYFYTYELNPTYIGYIYPYEQSTNLKPNALCYDGSHILFTVYGTQAPIYGIDMPANTSAINGGTFFVTTKNTKNFTSNESTMLWTGDGVIVDNNGTGHRHIRFTGSGLSGGSTNFKDFGQYASTMFKPSISYKWRQMIYARYYAAFTFFSHDLYTE